jgi:hypothetical protein
MEAREHADTLTRLDPDKKHIDALKDWTGASVPWLEELYNVTAHFDMRDGFHLTEFKGDPRTQQLVRAGNTKIKDKYAGVMTLLGEALPKDEPSIKGLATAVTDPIHQAGTEVIKNGPGTGTNAKKEVKQFALKVNVIGQPSTKYSLVFTPPAVEQRPNFGQVPAELDLDDEGGE